MIRQMSRGNIRMSDIWTGAMDGKVSIYCSDQGVVIAPYQEGDENNTAKVIKKFGSRSRLTIPQKMRNRFGIDRCVNVVLNRDGSVLLLSPEDNSSNRIG